MVDYSLGEIDTLCRKATRGAGYSWGVAEEAGKAMRWLSAYSLDGPKILAQYFDSFDKKSQIFVPEYHQGIYSHPKNAICPLYCGTIINDFCFKVKDNQALTFNGMLYPMLVLPHVGRVAQALNILVSIKYADVFITCSSVGISIESLSSLEIEKTNVVCERVEAISKTTHSPKPKSHAIDTQTLEILEKFAHKTYAPATEESRLLGAGAGVNDND